MRRAGSALATKHVTPLTVRTEKLSLSAAPETRGTVDPQPATGAGTSAGGRCPTRTQTLPPGVPQGGGGQGDGGGSAGNSSGGPTRTRTQTFPPGVRQSGGGGALTEAASGASASSPEFVGASAPSGAANAAGVTSSGCDIEVETSTLATWADIPLGSAH